MYSRVVRGGSGEWRNKLPKPADSFPRYIKSDMLKELSDEVIDQSCARFHLIPDGCSEALVLRLNQSDPL
jgi:hypothetical protein